MKAWVFQDPKQVKKVGAEAAKLPTKKHCGGGCRVAAHYTRRGRPRKGAG
jgi:hypothetical protein